MSAETELQRKRREIVKPVTKEGGLGRLAEDADIEECARVRLQHSPYRAIRSVQCRFHEGVLTLLGSVPTYHYKQLAQTAVVGVVGVRSIFNEIQVG